MNNICIISTELPPVKKFITTADELNENIIEIFKNLNFNIFYIFIDEDRHHYTDSNPEKKIRIENIKSIANLYVIKKKLTSEIKTKINEIIKNNNLENFYIFQHCIDFIDKKKNRKILMLGLHDNKFPRDKNIYFETNLLKKIYLFVYYFFINLRDYFSVIKKLKKADVVLQPGRIYFNKWKKVLKKSTKLIFIPQCTKDYLNLVKSNTEINFFKNKKNCLLIGQPNSSLASANIKYLCETVFPILKKEKILDKFHFFIIGMIDGKLNSNIEHMMNTWTDHITITGYINDLHSIIYKSDAIIQINPIIPVAPTRIYGWSSLSPLLIANDGIKKNFPELKDEENCYMASDPKKYLKIFKNIYNKDSQNLQLRNNLRKLYEEKWNHKNFINTVENIFKDFYINKKIQNNYFQE